MERIHINIMDQQQQALHELLARTSGYNGYLAQVRVVVISSCESVTGGLCGTDGGGASCSRADGARGDGIDQVDGIDEIMVTGGRCAGWWRRRSGGGCEAVVVSQVWCSCGIKLGNPSERPSRMPSPVHSWAPRNHYFIDFIHHSSRDALLPALPRL